MKYGYSVIKVYCHSFMNTKCSNKKLVQIGKCTVNMEMFALGKFLGSFTNIYIHNYIA